MIRTSFNADWTVGPRTSYFSELAPGKKPPKPVTLPHDSMWEQPSDQRFYLDRLGLPGGSGRRKSPLRSGRTLVLYSNYVSLANGLGR